MTSTTYTEPARTVRVRETPLLRWALELDGAVSALNGLAYVVAAGAIGDLLCLPASLLRAAGAFLVVYGLALVVMSLRPRLRRTAVLAVVVLNALWVIDSVVVAVSGWFEPSGAVIAGFATPQGLGLRRAS